jgi:hypothetical protein
VVIDGVAAAKKERRSRSSRTSDRRGGAVAIAKTDCTGKSG